MTCETVAFFIFNRPDTTNRVFARIADARPKRLFVVADGARLDRPGELALCQQAREVVEHVNWPCDVQRNYSDRNMGCRDRLASGIKWVFDQVDEAIVLEDDCLPEPTFFRYAAELLERYRHDHRVMAISGDTFQMQPPATGASYYFSRYFHCWGWATWKRAWAHYDVALQAWPRVSGTDWLRERLDGDVDATTFWSQQFDAVHEGRVNTWDFQFVFACWMAGGMTILPRRNLVSNLGFRADATHTSDTTSSLARLATEPMMFPLLHPPLTRDHDADLWSQRHLFSLNTEKEQRASSKRRVLSFLTSLMPRKRKAA